MPVTPIAATTPSALAPAHPHPFADLYTFKWSAMDLRTPLISASAVAICLFTGVALGHPGGALVAGGGALTVGFGINQRIADSRVLPMLFGVFAISTATLAGTIAGHHGYSIVLCSVVSAAIYAMLTMRGPGIAWVAQQASIALFVASAFPSPLRMAWMRAALIFAGAAVQVLVTSVALCLLPELRKELTHVPRSLFRAIADRRRDLLRAVAEAPQLALPQDRRATLVYAARLMLTIALATEFYRRLGLQSGYWTPMTALLVQKPAFTETFTRAMLRVGGTLAGAVLSTVLIVHVPLAPPVLDWALAAVTTLFAFLAFATNPVNYGLYTLCLTAYIVFLLSLNQVPGPETAHRRALCTCRRGDRADDSPGRDPEIAAESAN